MNRKKHVEVRRFTVQPRKGQPVVIIEFDELNDVGVLQDGKTSWQFLRRIYRTITGGPVQLEDDGTFTVL